jgi:hypothetical protein
MSGCCSTHTSKQHAVVVQTYLESFSMMTKLSQAWPDLVHDDIIQQRVHVVNMTLIRPSHLFALSQPLGMC